MTKIEFLDPKETEKFKKQKRVQFCRTPCSIRMFKKRQGDHQHEHQHQQQHLGLHDNDIKDT